MPFQMNVYPARSRGQIVLQNAMYTAIAVISSLIITAAISLWLHDRVRFDFMFTAFMCSFTVSVPMTALFQRLNRALEDALARERTLLLREERQRALRETMSKAQHYVNNLANSLHLVELEYKKNNSLSAATLAALQAEIQRTGQEMQRISELDLQAAEEPVGSPRAATSRF